MTTPTYTAFCPWCDAGEGTAHQPWCERPRLLEIQRESTTIAKPADVYMLAEHRGIFDSLRRHILDPTWAPMVESIERERASLSDAARLERAKQRKERSELAQEIRAAGGRR